MKIAHAVAVLMLAGVARANPLITATAEPITDGARYSDRATTVYSCLGAPYAAFTAGAGSLGFDDYSSTIAGSADTLTSFRFVGGVTAAGGSLKFDFYSVSGVPVNTFIATLSRAGNFLWTIDLNPGIDIPAQGILEISTIGTATGQWYLRPGAPTLGSTSQTLGGFTNAGTHYNHAMEIVVPSSGALSLVGISGLVAIRRRR
jgi:hypothetical protein